MVSTVLVMGKEEVQLETTNLKSSRSQIFFKIDVPKTFAIFTRKHLCRSLFFNKIADLRACFPVNIVKFLRTAFL